MRFSIASWSWKFAPAGDRESGHAAVQADQLVGLGTIGVDGRAPARRPALGVERTGRVVGGAEPRDLLPGRRLALAGLRREEVEDRGVHGDDELRLGRKVLPDREAGVASGDGLLELGDLLVQLRNGLVDLVHFSHVLSPQSGKGALWWASLPSVTAFAGNYSAVLAARLYEHPWLLGSALSRGIAVAAAMVRFLGRKSYTR